ncbi:NAD-dependent epimerase [Vibrio sp. 10N.261.51.F12]|uniref:NAD-dependent epimerase n=1 Tax=Vibrio sp. 10N.261.51.F12 TaxID=3229679 RepID=UPI0035528DFB
MKYLVTGVAGFIGSATALKLCQQGEQVIGIDNLNDYYDVDLKKARLARLNNYSNFSFIHADLFDKELITTIFSQNQFERVIHLGAQAGVRYSLDNPNLYSDTNLTGHLNILEGCRHNDVEHLIYASSSSVYGMNEKQPFTEHDAVDHPVSLYAATKRANELISHTYSHLYHIPTTGLRFFTVYGPWGRPDMAPFKFAKAIIEGNNIDVYNYGDMMRDFTYIDDIVEGILKVKDVIPEPGGSKTRPNESSAPYSIYNIGNGSPIKLLDFISTLENALGIEAKKNFLPMQAGDVPSTWADTTSLQEAVDYAPRVGIKEGVPKFVDWFKEYYK